VFTKLIRLQYNFFYRKDFENRVVDAFSRHLAPTDQLMAMSTITPVWLDTVQEGYVAYAKTHQLIAALGVSPQSIPHFTLCNGILHYKNKVWIGANVAVQKQILETMHSSAIGGHSGFPVTYRKFKQLFAWAGMKAATKSFVSSCAVCQQAKPNKSKYPGLLSPVLVPSGAWQTISLDFIEALPRSGSANCILVLVDKFSKYSNFLPLLHPFTAATVAQIFLNQVYKLHGMTLAIISDRDRIFTNQFC
jgi:hypothetical protein